MKILNLFDKIYRYHYTLRKFVSCTGYQNFYKALIIHILNRNNYKIHQVIKNFKKKSPTNGLDSPNEWSRRSALKNACL